ncbi:MAG: nicotinate (nicotinamide) nucleotide adenylyltransferase [Oscillospiraceae bacterium]|nr:nicotinate (nicotinamide) nucleotide adenylyltransferase [Oscillospiraceae bacterium]
MRIGVYGGTFNPIHIGHLEAARSAVKKLRLDKLLLIPTGLPPHKKLGAGAPPPEKRLEMTALAAETLECGAEVLDLELRREGKSYTLDTLRELKNRFPKDRFFLMMGTDMFLSFQEWREPKKIARLCTLCAFSRDFQNGQDAFSAQKKFLKKSLNADVELISLPQVIEISSTQLRQDLSEKRELAKKYLTPAVYGYILREGLYGTGADLRHLPLDGLRYVAQSMLKHSRIPHVLGTESTAAALAVRWGADETAARRAALLHDCTKKFDREQHLHLCRQYSAALDAEELREGKLLHALTGSLIAQEVFGESKEVVEAIRWHTTGKADMSLLEKIIYLADYIEPTRSFCGLTGLRRLAFEDLDRALLLGLTMAVEDLEKNGMTVHSQSVFARDYLKGKLT